MKFIQQLNELLKKNQLIQQKANQELQQDNKDNASVFFSVASGINAEISSLLKTSETNDTTK